MRARLPAPRRSPLASVASGRQRRVSEVLPPAALLLQAPSPAVLALCGVAASGLGRRRAVHAGCHLHRHVLIQRLRASERRSVWAPVDGWLPSGQGAVPWRPVLLCNAPQRRAPCARRGAPAPVRGRAPRPAARTPCRRCTRRSAGGSARRKHATRASKANDSLACTGRAWGCKAVQAGFMAGFKAGAPGCAPRHVRPLAAPPRRTHRPPRGAGAACWLRAGWPTPPPA